MTDYKKLNLSEAIAAVERASSEARRDFGSLTVDQLNWKPGPQQWSVGECLEHLIAAHGAYFGVVEPILSGNYSKPFLGRIPGYAALGGKLLVGAVSPQSERKVKTMPVFEPARSTVDADEVQRFADHQKKLADLMRRSEAIDLNKTIIASPATSAIVYSLMDAWRLIAAHGLRHLDQARRVVQADGFPS